MGEAGVVEHAALEKAAEEQQERRNGPEAAVTTTLTVAKVGADYFSAVAVREPRAERVFRDVP
jgi:hypothetical protein